jgi:hypothetical protein
MATRKNISQRRRQRMCARNNATMRGGNLGQGFRLGAEMLTRGVAAIEPYGDCGAVSRPGQLSTDVTGALAKGLPGVSGGGRGKRSGKKNGSKKNGSKKNGSKKQRGGRYEAVMTGDEFVALGPRGGMLATAGQLPCERGAGAYVSPTVSTMPSRQAGGGGAQLAPAPFLQEQTAGYTMKPSEWLGSTGTPFELRVPVGGRMDVPACKTTGGGRRRRGGGNQNYSENQENSPLIDGSGELQFSLPEATLASRNSLEGGRRRNRKASRKSRKVSRKNRKASRKNRTASRKSRR